MTRRQYDVRLARSLLSQQCRQWADDDVQPLDSDGTDHTLFRLGNDKLIRLPLAEWATGQAIKEARWLPLMRDLPIAISQPLFLGSPSEYISSNWSIVRWVEGAAADSGSISDWDTAASTLATFLAALWQKDITGGPISGAHNSQRGVPLDQRDESVQKSLLALRDIAPVKGLADVWSNALNASPHEHLLCWIHGDLHAGNLIASNDKLAGIIDWGLMGVGDPAADVMVAWTVLPASARGLFRDELECDDATWTRAKGWAVYSAVIALACYQGQHEPIERRSKATINAVLEDY